jgi:predicted membrane-bound spermidine synthase
MNKFLKQNLLLISVFITGACVLVVEVVAVRALSPHYGNTIFTVSSVISVILAALSIGYYAGGKFADKHPSLQWFFGIILVSGLVVLAIHFLGIIILPILSVSLSLASGPLISSLLLFLAPALLLGHESVATTQIYTKVADERLRAVADFAHVA